jgi:hypothetical protein
MAQESVVEGSPGRFISHLRLGVCSTNDFICASEDIVMRVKQLAAELLQTARDQSWESHSLCL